MENPGKLIFKELDDSNLPALKEFCSSCKRLGYHNNESFQTIKLDKMKMPYGKFFIGIDSEKIVTLAGVHKLPEVNEHAWRCLFRGAQLPGYTPVWSMNIFKSCLQFNQLLYQQIKVVQQIDIDAEFYISTNIDSTTGAKSSRMNDKIMPRIEKQGVCKLYLKNFMLYNVSQNIWKIDVEEYFRQRKQYYPAVS